MAKEVTGKAKEAVESNGWHWLEITSVNEDQYGCELSDGTYYEPTFKKGFQVMALRTDGEYFSVNITLDKDEIDMNVLQAVVSKLKNALHTLETFRKCKCTAEKRCSVHQ